MGRLRASPGRRDAPAGARRGGRRRAAARDSRRSPNATQAAHDNARGEALYDSAEQRLELVGELEHVADTETVEARVVAAVPCGL
jgi:hypothetical protein